MTSGWAVERQAVLPDGAGLARPRAARRCERRPGGSRDDADGEVTGEVARPMPDAPREEAGALTAGRRS
ncbi:hypothetical protein ACNTMW_14365 [Planosporangium sp. 12N6]|uniref:hypothetical protein n=1 Tax=Planosporangium spinosum TaxID=3402278 RepID=UPI003CF8F717